MQAFPERKIFEIVENIEFILLNVSFCPKKAEKKC